MKTPFFFISRTVEYTEFPPFLNTFPVV